MDEKKKMKMAIIAGASEAMKYKNKNPSATVEEVIRHVSVQSTDILSKIDTAE